MGKILLDLKWHQDKFVLMTVQHLYLHGKFGDLPVDPAAPYEINHYMQEALPENTPRCGITTSHWKCYEDCDVGVGVVETEDGIFGVGVYVLDTEREETQDILSEEWGSRGLIGTLLSPIDWSQGYDREVRVTEVEEFAEDNIDRSLDRIKERLDSETPAAIFPLTR